MGESNEIDNEISTLLFEGWQVTLSYEDSGALGCVVARATKGLRSAAVGGGGVIHTLGTLANIMRVGDARNGVKAAPTVAELEAMLGKARAIERSPEIDEHILSFPRASDGKAMIPGETTIWYCNADGSARRVLGTGSVFEARVVGYHTLGEARVELLQPGSSIATWGLRQNCHTSEELATRAAAAS